MDRRDALKHTALLMGGLLSASTVAGVLAGCKASNKPNWQPQFLTKEMIPVVDALAETLIPATDTPGAKDAGVTEFIDVMLAKYKEKAEQDIFMAGLTQVETDCQAAHQKSFADLAPEQQTAYLKQMAEAAVGKRNTFFHELKGLTFTGYFTSELVGKNVLNFDPIPGRYDPCMPVEEVNNIAWTI